MAKRPSLSSSMRTLQENTSPDPEALVAARPVPAPVTPITAPAAAAGEPAPPRLTGKRHAGMKKMLIPMEEEMHRRLKVVAIEQKLSLEKAVQAACADYIERHTKA